MFRQDDLGGTQTVERGTCLIVASHHPRGLSRLANHLLFLQVHHRLEEVVIDLHLFEELVGDQRLCDGVQPVIPR